MPNLVKLISVIHSQQNAVTSKTPLVKSNHPLTPPPPSVNSNLNSNKSLPKSISSSQSHTDIEKEILTELSLPLSINYPADKILSLSSEEQRSLSDEFMAHQRLFGFQSSNIKNQYEHLAFLITNARDRYGSNAYSYLHARLFSNYRRWVNHINAQRWCFQRKICHNFTNERYDDRNKLQDIILWLCIWGEAANCRHMPEFICFLFYRMSQQRARVIEDEVIGNDHSYDQWFRRAIIEPTYTIVAAMSTYQRNNGTLKDHLNRPHYDDINEYFWNRKWLDSGENYNSEDKVHWWGTKFIKNTLDIDPKTGLPQLVQKEGNDVDKSRKDRNRLIRKTFIEKRSWLNLWRSFDRIVELHFFILHILIVLAYGFWGNWNIMASSVLTLAGFDALSECLEVLFYWGVIFHLGMFMNLLLRWFVKIGIFLVGFYLCYIDSIIFLYAAAAYLGLRILMEFVDVQGSRWLRKWHLSEDRNFESRVASQLGFRRLYQTIFWILIFGVKAVVSYYSYVLPLISLTTTLYRIRGWAGADGLTPNNSSSYSNSLLVISLWIPTITIYLVDTQVFYSTAIVILGLFLGIRDNVANIRNWNDVESKWMRSWLLGSRKFFSHCAIMSVNVDRMQVPSSGHVRNILNLPILLQPPWHLIAVLWRNIIEEMRSADMISFHDEQLLHFGHYQLHSKGPITQTQSNGNVLAEEPQPRIQQQPPLSPPPNTASHTQPQIDAQEVPSTPNTRDFYFMPAFITAGKLQTLLTLTGACEDSKHRTQDAQSLVISELHRMLRSSESTRLALDEAYTATSLLLRIFIPDCKFDPSTEGNKVLDYALRNQVPHTVLNDTMKAIVTAINEAIAICFDMGYQSIVRKRPVASTDSNAANAGDGWMERAEQVNTKTFVTVMQNLYKIWFVVEYNKPWESVGSVEAPTVNAAQLDEVEINGSNVLLRVLYHLLSTATMDARPHNGIVTDRLMFFLSSLNTNMPNRVNSIKEMYSWSVLTPYVDELVIYTEEDMTTPNDDDVTQEFYLQSVYRKEWLNFIERMSTDPQGHDPAYQLQQKREWCSYRGQTLLRTVRGMMFYEKALKLLALLEMNPGGHGHGNPKQEIEAQAIARRKYTYILSCQKYGTFHQSRGKRDRGELVDRKQLPEAVRKDRCKQYDEAKKADDIDYMLRKWPHLRVAYVDEKDKVFYSVLIKAKEITPEEMGGGILSDSHAKTYGMGDDLVEVYRIRLPGNILVGEGKPENQNHALIFTRGEMTEAIDMNQDGYFEEALKIRNLLEEFDPHRAVDEERDEILRVNPVASKRSQAGILQCSILGFRELIFTANLMSVGTYMSLMEATFVSITLRTFAFFGSRFHYGHPDLLDKLFFMTRGGVSKASKMLHVSEDIFAGFKSTLRGGRIDHREYTQCGKGRDLGFNQLFLFEAKLASGAGEQALSREGYRLGRYLDLPRLMSVFYGATGFYTTTTLLLFAVTSMLFARVLLALTNIDAAIFSYSQYNNVSIGLLSGTTIYQLGLLLTLPMLAEIALERTLIKAATTLAWMVITGSPLFFFFHMATKSFFFNNSLLYGGAKYRATGRGFVLSRDSLTLIYTRYARTHIYPAMKIVFLLVVYGIFYNTGLYIEATWAPLLLVVAWLFAPVWFNPMAFDHEKVLADFTEWKRWLTRVSPNEEESWQGWWVQEHSFVKQMPFNTMVLNISSNILIPFIIIVCAVANTNSESSAFYFLIISFGGTVGLVFLAVLIMSVCKPIGQSWRLLKFLMFFALIGFAIVSFVDLGIPGANTTCTDNGNNSTSGPCAGIVSGSPGKSFAVFLICVLLTFNACCKVLVYFGAGPFRFSFVLSWFRWIDGLYGLIIYIPWLLLSFFDFTAIQTRLLYNLAFSKGVHVQTILHRKQGQMSGRRPPAKNNGRRLDREGNIVYRALSRLDCEYDGMRSVTPTGYDIQRKKIGLPPSEAKYHTAQDGTMLSNRMGGNPNASFDDTAPPRSISRNSRSHNNRISPAFQVEDEDGVVLRRREFEDEDVENSPIDPQSESVVSSAGLLIESEETQVLASMKFQRERAAAAMNTPLTPGPVHSVVVVPTIYSYEYTSPRPIRVEPASSIEEENLDPVMLVYNDQTNPGSALRERREGEFDEKEEDEQKASPPPPPPRE